MGDTALMLGGCDRGDSRVLNGGLTCQLLASLASLIRLGTAQLWNYHSIWFGLVHVAAKETSSLCYSNDEALDISWKRM